jgi:hypothetical protein
MERMQIRAAVLCLILGAAIIFLARTSSAASIREVQSSPRNLIAIRTALGFSTILEFPLKPLSAVLGDQDAVKLEYIGESITLKPLANTVRTNLFVFTPGGRYAFSIQNSPASSVDYIVRVRDPENVDTETDKHDVNPFKEKIIQRKRTVDGVSVVVSRLSLSKDEVSPRSASLIEFEISSSETTYSFKPSSIALKQDGRFLIAESITIDRPWIGPDLPISKGVIALLNQDFDRRKPMSLIFAFNFLKGKKTVIRRIGVTFTAAHEFKSSQKKRKEVMHGEVELFPKTHP